MTREEHFIKKTKLLAQIDSAEKLGCKNVLKCAKLELAKLESKYKKEHLSNPLFSYTVTRKEMDKLISGGRAVKLGDDLYALPPSKQNETCNELTNPKDGKLQIALFEAQDIERTWLKSLTLER